MVADAEIVARTCLLNTLRRGSRSVTAHYESRLAAVGMSAGQFTILAALAVAPAASVAEVGRRIGADRTTLSRLLTPLRKRGLIGPGETRTSVQLTQAGQTLFDRALPLWEAAQNELVARLGGDNADTLRRLAALL